MTTERIDTKMPLECGDCGTQWDEHFSLPMNVTAFVKKGKAMACPKCGSKKIYMLPKGDFHVPDNPVEFKHGPERIRDLQVR